MLGIAIALSFMALRSAAAPAMPSQRVANAGPCRTIAARGRQLDRTFRSGKFRIRYTIRGKDALANSADMNRDGVPDVVEDLSRQLDAAQDYYMHVLGLVPPLSQPRYARADAIDILIQELDGNNGVAFDEVVREPGDAHCKLVIMVDSDVQPSKNSTAAHELFHLYQYGYAMFKVPWYLEGMARWIEGIFVEPQSRGSIAVAAPIPCEGVVKRSYDAALFWRAVASQVLPDQGVEPANSLPRQRYTNGDRVIANDRFPGSIVQPILEGLHEMSLRSSNPARRSFDWPEAVQKSHLFDRQICQSLESVLASGWAP